MSLDVTDEEITKLAEIMEADPYRFAHPFEVGIRMLFGHLAMIRQGDRVGTVRRSPDGEYVMKANADPLRTQDRSWLSTGAKVNYWRFDKDVKDWPIVYTPAR